MNPNPQDAPKLDEIQWRGPAILQQIGGLTVHTLHWYFHNSPFQISTSSNSSLITQCQFNPSLHPILWNRDSFESRLKKMRGVEFTVAYPPPNTQPGAAGIREGVFVMRKQLRTGPDEVRVLGTYFCVNTNIYMAPTMEKVVGSKVLSISRALSDAERIVRELREEEAEGGGGAGGKGGGGGGSSGGGIGSGKGVAGRGKSKEEVKNEGMLRFSFANSLKFGGEFLDGDSRRDGSQSLSQSQNQSQTNLGSLNNSQASTATSSTQKDGPKVKTEPGLNGKDERVGTPVPAAGAIKKRRKSKAFGDGLSTPKAETPGGSFK